MNRSASYHETTSSSDVITFGDLGKSFAPALLVGLPASLLGFTLIPIILKPFASALNDTFEGATGDETELNARK